MFLLKKIAAPFLFPVPLCLELLLVGLILLWGTRRQITGKVLTSIGFVLLAVLSYRAVPTALLKPLEHKYPPLVSIRAFSDVRWIVVLGGGHVSDPKLPITSQISDSSLIRLVEGIRIHNELHTNKLVLSGGGAFDPVPEARVMADVALALGVKEKDLIMESASNDTKDQARLIKEIVGNEPFILVTSASHMPRSMVLFQRLGMKPIAAPTGHRVKEEQMWRPHMYFPSPNGLANAHRAFYEYLGLAWAKLRGQI